MFNKFFESYPHYQIIEKPQVDQLDKYRSALPNQLIYLWKNYGWGIYMNGYLRLINPVEYKDFAEDYIESTGGNYIPWATTVFGDLLVWNQYEDGQIEFYNYRYKDFEIVASKTGIENLLNNRLCDDYFLDEVFKRPVNFREVEDKLGIPAYGQCYGYFPLLALGGNESVEQVQIVDIKIHMDLMAQVSGPL